MKLKVCGMRDGSNIAELVKIGPDFIGFIFYLDSKRFVGDDFDKKLLDLIPGYIQKVGVFVNANLKDILKKQKKYRLDLIQLHGDESPEDCSFLKGEGLRIIKVFQVDASFDFDDVRPYVPYSEYFLFDTKGEKYGGNGVSFDWKILKNYKEDVPFFLSGGIDLENIGKLDASEQRNIFALDVNSKFENAPGIKDISKIKELVEAINEFESKA